MSTLPSGRVSGLATKPNGWSFLQFFRSCASLLAAAPTISNHFALNRLRLILKSTKSTKSAKPTWSVPISSRFTLRLAHYTLTMSLIILVESEMILHATLRIEYCSKVGWEMYCDEMQYNIWEWIVMFKKEMQNWIGLFDKCNKPIKLLWCALSNLKLQRTTAVFKQQNPACCLCRHSQWQRLRLLTGIQQTVQHIEIWMDQHVRAHAASGAHNRMRHCRHLLIRLRLLTCRGDCASWRIWNNVKDWRRAIALMKHWGSSQNS